jgi:hypothetical protein
VGEHHEMMLEIVGFILYKDAVRFDMGCKVLISTTTKWCGINWKIYNFHSSYFGGGRSFLDFETMFLNKIYYFTN